MDVERGGVALLRMPCEVRGGVPSPPQLRELRERFAMVRNSCRATETLGSLEVGVQRRGVGFATDDARAGAALFIAPSHAPDGSAGALDLLDAHRARARAALPAAMAASAWTSARKLPAGAGRPARAADRGGASGRRGVWRCEVIQALKSSGVMRMRERSLTARSSPSAIARRTAVSDNLHAAATSLTVNSTSPADATWARAVRGRAATRNDAGLADVQKVCVTVIDRLSSACAAHADYHLQKSTTNL